MVTHVSGDVAAWVRACVKQRCPRAVICMDALRVVPCLNDAVDEVRRQHWNEHRDAGGVEQAANLKGVR